MLWVTPLLVTLREEQVLRLDVPVHDRRPVRLVEGQGRLVQDRDRLGRGQAPEALEALRDLLAAEQLHDEEGHLRRLVVAGVEDVDDELALDVGGDLRLALEALAQIGALEDVREHHLQRAPALGLEVHDLVDGPHAALRDAADDPVAVGEDRVRSEARRGHDALRMGR
jgi:hypothetical protein